MSDQGREIVTTGKPLAIGYTTPSRRAFRIQPIGVYYILYFIVLALAAFAWWMMFACIQVLASILKDSKTTLPSLSEDLIECARWFWNPILWVAVLGALFVVAWLLARWTMRLEKTLERLIVLMMVFIFLTLITLIGFIFMQGVMLLPFVRLIQ